jgi:hypothetical protein
MDRVNCECKGLGGIDADFWGFAQALPSENGNQNSGQQRQANRNGYKAAKHC